MSDYFILTYFSFLAVCLVFFVALEVLEGLGYVGDIGAALAEVFLILIIWMITFAAAALCFWGIFDVLKLFILKTGG